MSFQLIAADTYKVRPPNVTELKKLPIGVYSIEYDPELGFYVKKSSDSFLLPEKIYGSNDSLVKAIYDRFTIQRIGKVTTAVLSGVKGSGKTLAAKQVSTMAAEDGMCTFLLSKPFHGSKFSSFLTDLQLAQDSPIIVLVDEFEKVYQERDEINGLLTLLDGTASLHMCTLLTMNTSLDDRRYEFFKNRPGRAYFNKHFESCPEEVIREYCEDNLGDTSRIEEIVAFSYRFKDFTLDLLSTLVKETNLAIPRTPLEVICDYVNIKPDLSSHSSLYYVQVLNMTTGQPVLNNSQVSVSYDFSNAILQYNKSEVTFTYLKGTPEYEACLAFIGGEWSKATPTYTTLNTGAIMTFKVNVVGEVLTPVAVNLDYSCSIDKVGEEILQEDTSLKGSVNLADREITFVFKEENSVVKIKSRNSRPSTVERLVL